MGQVLTVPPCKYNAPIPNTGNDRESPVYRDPRAVNKEDLVAYTNAMVTTVGAQLQWNLKKAPDNQFIGWRKSVSNEDPEDKTVILEDQYSWWTYKEADQLAKSLGSAIKNLDFAPFPKKPNYLKYKVAFIVIFARTSHQYILLDSTCALYGYTSVPIYDTLKIESLEYVLKHTNAKAVFTNENRLREISGSVKLEKHNKLDTIVVMGDFAKGKFTDLLKTLKLAGIEVWAFDDLITEGEKQPIGPPMVKKDDIYCICYTSGTTGNPRGAMVTHKNIMSVASCPRYERIWKDFGEIPCYLSYLPLAHVYERVMLVTVIVHAGKYGCYSGDASKITDDLAILKPNLFASVPRQQNKFYVKIKQILAEVNSFKKMVAQYAFVSKTASQKNGLLTHWLYDSLLFSAIKDILGGNVRLIVTGSAPITKDVLDYLKVCFCCPIIEGYGLTESTGLMFSQHPDDWFSGSCGGIISSLEFKQVSVPEMSYTVKDTDDQGNVTPKGEILVRGHGVVAGYWKDTKLFKANNDEQGWFHTGDIGMIEGPINSLKIIDRKMNIFKLSSGICIPPDRLENAYKVVEGVIDIFVYGNAIKPYLVAIICVEKELFFTLMKYHRVLKNDVEELTDELLNGEKIHAYMIKQQNQQADKVMLKPHEKLRKIHLITKSFQELGLVTNSYKLIRNITTNYFERELIKQLMGDEAE